MTYLVISGWNLFSENSTDKQILFKGASWEDALNYAEEAAARKIKTRILTDVPFANEENLDDVISKNVKIQYLTSDEHLVFIGLLFHYQGMPLSQRPLWSGVRWFFEVTPEDMAKSL